MDNLNELKEIWLTAKTKTLPDAAEIVETIKNYRLKEIVKIISFSLFTLGLLATMIWVLIDYKSQLITTRAGEVFILIGIFILLTMNAKALKRSFSLNNYSNEAFLTYLKKEQLKLIDYQKRTQKAGFIIASSGLLLYIYEGVRHSISILIISYIVVSLWIAISWFIIRPYSLKRKTQKLLEKIATLEKISSQLK